MKYMTVKVEGIPYEVEVILEHVSEIIDDKLTMSSGKKYSIKKGEKEKILYHFTKLN